MERGKKLNEVEDKTEQLSNDAKVTRYWFREDDWSWFCFADLGRQLSSVEG